MGGTTVYGSRAITVDTGGVLNVVLASSAGDDFTVDTNKLVVSGDSGAVGIGTATPGAKLDLYNGAMYISTTGVTHGLTSIAPTNVVALITAVGQSDGGMRIDGMSSATTVPFMIRGIFGSTNPTDANVAVAFRAGRRSGTGIADLAAAETGYQFQTAGGVAQLTILGSGNVGIGTATPGQLLDVNGTVVFSGNTAGKNTFEFSTHASNEGRLRIKNVDTDTVQIRAGGDSYFNGGNVGIGTAAPDSKLHVVGTVNVRSSSLQTFHDSANALNLKMNDGGVTFNEDSADKDFRIESDGDAFAFFLEGSSGNVGIGTAAPASYGGIQANLEVKSTTHALIAINSSATSTYGSLQFAQAGTRRWALECEGTATPALSFNEAGSIRMTLDNGGNVGIGTTSPGHPLDILTTGAVTALGVTSNESVNISIDTTQTNGDEWQIQSVVSGTKAELRFRDIDTGTYALVLEQGGNVGFSVSPVAHASSYTQIFLPLTSTINGIGGVDGNIVIMQNGYNHTGNNSFYAASDQASQYYQSAGTHNFLIAGVGTADAQISWTAALVINNSGNVTISGALSKGSGSFKIDHPLPSLSETHSLVHSFIEGPRADLIYRGSATLVDGAATVDLDDAAGMTAGTWVLLCRDAQVFTTNETGWFHVRGTVSDSTLTITCEEGTCTDTVSWMVVAERQDDEIRAQSSTDEEGHLILEPLMTEEDSPSTSASPSE
jgi:hypothetical protein